MAQDDIDLISPVDERDRDMARDAQERMDIKATLIAEVLQDQVAKQAIDSETPLEDKLKALKYFTDVTAAGERAKRQLAAEGIGAEAGPVFQVVLSTGAAFNVSGVVLEEREDEDEDAVEGVE